MSKIFAGLRWAILPLMVAAPLFFSGCRYDADVVSENLSVAADQFEISRRIVFYNGITGEYVLVIAPVQRRAAQRTVRCNRLLADQRTGFGGGLWELNPQKLVD